MNRQRLFFQWTASKRRIYKHKEKKKRKKERRKSTWKGQQGQQRQWIIAQQQPQQNRRKEERKKERTSTSHRNGTTHFPLKCFHHCCTRAPCNALPVVCVLQQRLLHAHTNRGDSKVLVKHSRRTRLHKGHLFLRALVFVNKQTHTHN